MREVDLIKYSVFILTLTITGCAANKIDSNAMESIEKGLSSAEQAAQTGRKITDSGATVANSAGLTNILVEQLGVSQQQALGGAGAIFQTAKESMTQEAFASLSQSTPGMSDMLNAAPVVSDSLSDLTSLSAMMGDTDGTLGNMASLASSFQQLGLSPEMVGQFVPIVTNYVKETSGQVTANLLQSILPLP
jgi:hypothetical protein